MLGTFYTATGLMGTYENGQLIADAGMITALARKGHEIGGHTHGHIDVQRTSRRDLLSDIERNEAEIAALVGQALPMSFAYPFGMISVPSKLLLMRRYPALRGIKVGTNRGMIDLAHLQSQELYDSANDSASIERMLNDLERRPGWLIFYTHDVREEPSSIGCSPRFFAEVVQNVQRRGLRVEPVVKTLQRLGLV